MRPQASAKAMICYIFPILSQSETQISVYYIIWLTEAKSISRLRIFFRKMWVWFYLTSIYLVSFALKEIDRNRMMPTASIIQMEK